jgi:hypothetical protein
MTRPRHNGIGQKFFSLYPLSVILYYLLCRALVNGVFYALKTSWEKGAGNLNSFTIFAIKKGGEANTISCQ